MLFTESAKPTLAANGPGSDRPRSLPIMIIRVRAICMLFSFGVGAHRVPLCPSRLQLNLFVSQYLGIGGGNS